MPDRDRDEAGRIAVLDNGKTNLKISVATQEGVVIESVSLPNTVLPGPPWRHHDLAGLGDWALEQFAALSRRHPIGHIVPVGHGSGGVLVGNDPEAAGGGAALPMIDYEQPLPPGIAEAYALQSGTFQDRGSAIMMASTHQARQMLWMERDYPAEFTGARFLLGVPQYWAWRLSGVAASETSYLGAQSHLWNVPEKRWAPIVEQRGWRRLMPPFASAWSALGPLRPEPRKRFGIQGDIVVHAGAHDSSANFYRFQAAGMDGFSVLSTGTWIVALSDSARIETLDEMRGMTLNSDVFGRPLGGALTMGGREFTAIAGPHADGVVAEIGALAGIVRSGAMALPSFGSDDGQFAGSAGRGRFVGPTPTDPVARRTLAVLHVALLAVECLDALGVSGAVVLDGSYLADPLFAVLVDALHEGGDVLTATDPHGVAAGAALLALHSGRDRPVPATLGRPLAAAGLPDLAAYRQLWRRKAAENLGHPT
jgi:sugar (pentulose or hexulose) kinase